MAKYFLIKRFNVEIKCIINKYILDKDHFKFSLVSIESLDMIVDVCDDGSIVSFKDCVRGYVNDPTFCVFLVMSFLPINLLRSIFYILAKGISTINVPTNPKNTLIAAVGMYNGIISPTE